MALTVEVRNFTLKIKYANTAKKVKKALIDFNATSGDKAPEDFLNDYNKLLNNLQHHFGDMRPTPIVSLSADAVRKRYLQSQTD